MRLLVPAVAAAAVLVLAGCSEPEPGSPLPTGAEPGTTAAPSEVTTAPPSTRTPEPTAGETATPTAEPSAVPTEAPTLPTEATTNDAAGAEAFVRYWFETVNWAYATGELEPMRKISSDDCSACASIADEIEAYRKSGRLYENGAIEVSEAVSPAPDGTGVGLVAVAYEQEASRVLDSEGGEVARGDARSISVDAVIQRVGDLWTLYDLGQ